MRRVAAAIGVVFTLVSYGGRADSTKASIPPARAMKMLVEGNARFVRGASKTTHRTVDRRALVAKGQAPFAVIVSCSDSRVPPELLFDQGLGDLFVTRLAGAIVDDAAIGSIEYAVEHLHAKLIVVVGHERCGAVSAAAAGGEAPGKIGTLVDAILPSVEKVKGRPGNLVDNAIAQTVRDTVAKLRAESSIIEHEVKAGKVKVVGAVYDLDTGKVIVQR